MKRLLPLLLLLFVFGCGDDTPWTKTNASVSKSEREDLYYKTTFKVKVGEDSYTVVYPLHIWLKPDVYSMKMEYRMGKDGKMEFQMASPFIYKKEWVRDDTEDATIEEATVINVLDVHDHYVATLEFGSKPDIRTANFELDEIVYSGNKMLIYRWPGNKCSLVNFRLNYTPPSSDTDLFPMMFFMMGS